GFGDLIPPETVDGVVIDDADSLHPRVDDGRAHELESPAFQVLRDCRGERGLRWKRPARTCHDVPFRERPTQCAEILASIAHLTEDARARDRRLDLGMGPDDSRIVHEPVNVALGEAGDPVGVEARKRLTECLTLAQYDDPREASLETFEHQHLPQSAGIALWNAPLFV